MEELSFKEILRSKEEKHILTGKISGIEDEYYKYKNENIPCAIIWYGETKVLIPASHLGPLKINKSMIRGMLGAEIDFIVLDVDLNSNIAIASRIDAMNLRAQLELPKLKKNDTVKQGQVIGKSGTNSIDKELGNHLHFELYLNSQVVNPGDYFDKEIKAETNTNESKTNTTETKKAE